MAKGEPIEREGFHNQTLTEGAKLRAGERPAQETRRHVVALRLDACQHAALRHLGGPEALKALLCPPGLCIACREAPSRPGTRYDAYCARCAGDQDDAPA